MVSFLLFTPTLSFFSGQGIFFLFPPTLSFFPRSRGSFFLSPPTLSFFSRARGFFSFSLPHFNYFSQARKSFVTLPSHTFIKKSAKYFIQTQKKSIDLVANPRNSPFASAVFFFFFNLRPNLTLSQKKTRPLRLQGNQYFRGHLTTLPRTLVP